MFYAELLEHQSYKNARLNIATHTHNDRVKIADAKCPQGLLVRGVRLYRASAVV